MANKQEIIDYLYDEVREVELPMDLIKIIISYLAFIPTKIVMRENIPLIQHIAKPPGKKACVWMAGEINIDQSYPNTSILSIINEMTKPQIIREDLYTIVNPPKKFRWTQISVDHPMIDTVIYNTELANVVDITPKYSPEINIAYAFITSEMVRFWKQDCQTIKTWDYQFPFFALQIVSVLDHCIIATDSHDSIMVELPDNGNAKRVGNFSPPSVANIIGMDKNIVGINKNIWAARAENFIHIYNGLRCVRILFRNRLANIHWMSPSSIAVNGLSFYQKNYVCCVSIDNLQNENAGIIEMKSEISYGPTKGLLTHIFTHNNHVFITCGNTTHDFDNTDIDAVKKFRADNLEKIGTDALIGHSHSRSKILLFDTDMKTIKKIHGGFCKMGILSDGFWYRYSTDDFLEIYEPCA